MFDLEELIDDSKIRDTINTDTEKDAEDNEVVNFQFQFDAPCIQLHLITESIRRNVSLQSN